MGQGSGASIAAAVECDSMAAASHGRVAVLKSPLQTTCSRALRLPRNSMQAAQDSSVGQTAHRVHKHHYPT